MRNLVVIGWLGLLVGLAVQGRIARDDRYAFAMFSEQYGYRIAYAWVDAAGVRWPHSARPYLFGQARQLLAPHLRENVLGPGTLVRQVRDYLRWLWEHHRAKDTVGLEARITLQRFERGPFEERIVRWPEP